MVKVCCCRSCSSIHALPSLLLTDGVADEGVVARGGSSGRGPDPVLSVPDGDGARPAAAAQGVHAAAQKQSKKCFTARYHFVGSAAFLK